MLWQGCHKGDTGLAENVTSPRLNAFLVSLGKSVRVGLGKVKSPVERDIYFDYTVTVILLKQSHSNKYCARCVLYECLFLFDLCKY